MINWIPVNSVIKQDHKFEISYTEVETLTGKEEMVSFKELTSRPDNTRERLHSSISIQVDMDKKIIVRQHYTALDLLSNLGGLSIAVLIIVNITYIILQLNVFENWLVY